MKLRLLPAAVLIVGCVDSLADLHVASGSSALSVSVARSSDLGGPIEPGIVGGTEHTGNPEVAFILAFDAQDNPLFSCTGTLIAPKLVLTAAHCVDDDPEPAAAYAVYFGTDVTVQEDPGELFLTSAESAVFHPGWDPNDLENGNDIGLIHLLDEVPIQPARLRTAPLTDADLGDPVHLVGWGITGGGRDDSGVKRHAFSRLDDFTDNLVVVGNSQTNTCNGDSGGPAFLERGGVEEIIGITSFGDTDCEIEGVSTRVDAFLDFIAANGGPGGGGPGGPGPGGFGAPCDEGAACESGLCLLQNGVGFCTDRCSATAPCPAEFECGEVDQTAVCVPGSGAGGDGGGALGDACTRDSDCASDLCATSADGTGFCTELCQGPFDCGAGFSCQSVEGGSICQPDEGGSLPPARGDRDEDEAGCSAAGGPGGGLLSPLAALLALALVRRRARRKVRVLGARPSMQE